MKFFVRVLFVSLLAVLAASLLASNLVGTWKGKITIDQAGIPKVSDPQQQMVNSQVEAAKKMTITLTLKANKTYTADVKGVPGKTGTEKNEGTWKQDGTTLWLTSVKDNGKPASDKKPQKFLVLDGGKKLTLAAEGMPAFIKITFTR